MKNSLMDVLKDILEDSLNDKVPDTTPDGHMDKSSCCFVKGPNHEQIPFDVYPIGLTFIMLFSLLF